jgi:hypothetical protein
VTTFPPPERAPVAPRDTLFLYALDGRDRDEFEALPVASQIDIIRAFLRQDDIRQAGGTVPGITVAPLLDATTRTWWDARASALSSEGRSALRRVGPNAPRRLRAEAPVASSEVPVAETVDGTPDTAGA